MPVVVSKIRSVQSLLSRKKLILFNLFRDEYNIWLFFLLSGFFGGQITDYYFSGNMAEESDESWMRSCLRRNPRLRILPRLEALAGWGGGEDLEGVLELEAHLEEVAMKVTAEERKHKPQQ